MTSRRTPRQEILRAIEEHPGSHLRALERILPFSLGALRHHLRRLEEAGLIRVEYDLRFKRYYPQAMTQELREACAALRQRQMRRIMVLLLSRPGMSTREISSTLGIGRSTLGGYLLRLKQKGAVLKQQDELGGWILASPKTVEAALIAYRPSFLDRVVDGALQVFEEVDPAAPAAEPGAGPAPPAVDRAEE
jgi:DNA-binding transcriptional ArsR family regulator